MMPEPGCQKPNPYLAPAELKKLYTSLLVSLALARSLSPPTYTDYVLAATVKNNTKKHDLKITKQYTHMLDFTNYKLR